MNDFRAATNHIEEAKELLENVGQCYHGELLEWEKAIIRDTAEVLDDLLN